MYDPSQLKRDLKTIADSMGEILPDGHYSKRVFNSNGLRIERTYKGFEASYEGSPINLQNVDINSKLGQYIIKLMVAYEERYFIYVVKSPCGSITTIY